MAPPKKDSKTRSSSSAVSLQKVKGENFYRNAKQVGRLKMLNGGKAVRDKDGKIIQAAAFQKGEDETKPGRVQPDRRWFGAYRTFMGFYWSLKIWLRQHKGNLPEGVGPLPHESCGKAA